MSETWSAIDNRPPRLDYYYRPGDPLSLVLNWPAGDLIGRSFSAVLGALTLGVVVNGDQMTISASAGQTSTAAALGDAGSYFQLIEDLGGGNEATVIAGWFYGSFDPSVGPLSSTITVLNGGSVHVSTGLPAGTADVFVPEGWGTTWQEARAATGSRLVRIGVMGDSVSCGLFVDDHDLGWVGRLRTTEQGTLGDAGSGWLDWFNSSLGAFGGPGGPNGGDTTATGAWTDVLGGGVNGQARRPTVSGNGATMTFHPRGTTIDIVTRTDPTFGRYDYQIDGGSVVQVPQNLTAAISTVTVTGLAPGAHTVIITAAAGQCRIHGVRGRNAIGLAVDNFSIGGRSIVSQGLGLDVAAEGLAGQTTLSTTFDVMPPLDLFILALGVNDAVQAAAPNYDTMWSVLSNLQREIRAAGINSTTPPEVIVLIEHISGFADTSVPYKYPRIASIVREWAESIGAAIVDMWAAGRHSGEYGAGLGWFGFGVADVHLATAGSIAYVEPVLAILDGA